jgi:hypothetical protein
VSFDQALLDAKVLIFEKDVFHFSLQSDAFSNVLMFETGCVKYSKFITDLLLIR